MLSWLGLIPAPLLGGKPSSHDCRGELISEETLLDAPSDGFQER